MRQARRIIASPYAKRLARDRGLDLSGLAGSGPGGRIVAVDIPAEQESRTVSATPATPQPQIAAFAVSLDLLATRDMVEKFAGAGLTFEPEDFLLRAFSQCYGRTFALKGGAGPVAVAGADGPSLAAIRDLRLGRRESAPEKGPEPVSVEFLDGGGVRPVFLPLPDRHHIRLVMSLDRDGTAADCLAVFDPDRIGENDVVSLLGNLKAALADPLAMLA